MGELLLDREGMRLMVQWGEHSAEIALDTLPNIDLLTTDARAYGRALFDALLPTAALHEAVVNRIRDPCLDSKVCRRSRTCATSRYACSADLP